MAELLFLGTGPAGGTKPHRPERRLESSTLLAVGGYRILIDTTTHFAEQSEAIPSLDAVLITHAHRDASGGVGDLDRWLDGREREIPLFSHPETIRKVRSRIRLRNLDLMPVSPYQSFELCDQRVRAFPVEHSLQDGFPTFGYRFDFEDGTSLAYVSDAASWDMKAERLMRDVSLLVIDGAFWERQHVKSHHTILEVLPKICQWPAERIIFTQIGNTVPPHDELAEEIKKRCHKAAPAYDGMAASIRSESQ